MRRVFLAGCAVLSLVGCAAPHSRLVECGEGPKQAAFIPRVWDDGQSTYFEFPAQTRIPAPFVVNPDGNEATTNYSVDGSVLTVRQTAPEFRLRDGKSVICIRNNAWNPIGASPGTGTISPDVERVPKQAAAR